MDTVTFDFAGLINLALAPILALFGVVVGSIGTYLVQTRLAKRHREWELDDQRREWQRSRLLALEDKVTESVAEITSLGIRRTDDRLEEVTQDEINLLAKHLSKIWTQTVYPDSTLSTLQDDFMKYAQGILYDTNIQLGTFDSLSTTYKVIIKRINELVEDTYK